MYTSCRVTAEVRGCRPRCLYRSGDEMRPSYLIMVRRMNGLRYGVLLDVQSTYPCWYESQDKPLRCSANIGPVIALTMPRWHQPHQAHQCELVARLQHVALVISDLDAKV